MSWKDFEENAFEYLKNEYSNFSFLKFKKHGGSNSNIPDIEILKNNKFLFYLECKLKESQIGQFVVLKDLKSSSFIFSSANKGNELRAQAIIKHMNDQFEYYSSKKSVALRCSKNEMIDSVKSYLSSKKVKFLISSNHHSDFVKYPIRITKADNIEKHFDISGVYREKKSGSSNLPAKDLENFKNILGMKFSSFKIEQSKGKTYVSFGESAPKSPYLKNSLYFLSKKNELHFEVRKLSNTNNSNVIFKLEPKIAIKTDDSKLFIESLNT